jgi:hypothetical protein
MSISPKFKLGCDPEWFLKDMFTGEPRSAIGRFQGTKDKPVPLNDGVSVQVDNCAVEYGITPASCMNEWMDRNLSAREQIEKKAAGMGLELYIAPSVVFPDTELDNELAWVFGCDPDLNAWTEEWNPKPKAANPNLRSGGGHVHFGFDLFEAKGMFTVAKAADMYLAVPGMLVDTDDRRRELYGKAGAMRMKPYGLEWRTASNFWTTTPTRISWLYRTVNNMLKAVRDGIIIPDSVREVIDKGDRVGATHLCKIYGLEVPE